MGWLWLEKLGIVSGGYRMASVHYRAEMTTLC